MIAIGPVTTSSRHPKGAAGAGLLALPGGTTANILDLLKQQVRTMRGVQKRADTSNDASKD